MKKRIDGSWMFDEPTEEMKQMGHEPNDQWKEKVVARSQEKEKMSTPLLGEWPINFDELRQHIGHDIECVCYGNNEKTWNVAIECVTCRQVLLDYDAPEVNDQ